MNIGFLSMWISNTATTAMMLPIVDAIAHVLNEQSDEEKCLEETEMKELTSDQISTRRKINPEVRNCIESRLMSSL